MVESPALQKLTSVLPSLPSLFAMQVILDPVSPEQVIILRPVPSGTKETGFMSFPLGIAAEVISQLYAQRKQRLPDSTHQIASCRPTR